MLAVRFGILLDVVSFLDGSEDLVTIGIIISWRRGGAGVWRPVLEAESELTEEEEEELLDSEILPAFLLWDFPATVKDPRLLCGSRPPPDDSTRPCT